MLSAQASAGCYAGSFHAHPLQVSRTRYSRLWCDSLAKEFRQQPENGKEKWFAGWKKKCRNIMEVRCEPDWNGYQAHSAPARENLRIVGTGEEEEGGITEFVPQDTKHPISRTLTRKQIYK